MFCAYADTDTVAGVISCKGFYMPKKNDFFFVVVDITSGSWLTKLGQRHLLWLKAQETCGTSVTAWGLFSSLLGSSPSNFPKS